MSPTDMKIDLSRYHDSQWGRTADMNKAGHTLSDERMTVVATMVCIVFVWCICEGLHDHTVPNIAIYSWLAGPLAAAPTSPYTCVCACGKSDYTYKFYHVCDAARKWSSLRAAQDPVLAQLLGCLRRNSSGLLRHSHRLSTTLLPALPTTLIRYSTSYILLRSLFTSTPHSTSA
jgi:hypothetical protein